MRMVEHENAAVTQTTASGGQMPESSGSHPYSGGAQLFISVKAVEWVLENSESTGNPRNVLTVIAAHLNSDGYSWPSFDRLMNLSKTSRPTLSKAIQDLEEIGELSVVRQDGRSNIYNLPMFMEAVGTSKEIGVNQSSAAPKPVNPSLPEEVKQKNTSIEEGKPLPLNREVRTALPKPEKKVKERKGLNQKPSTRPAYTPPPKAPESWAWFASLWHRYADNFPVSRPEHWETLEALLLKIKKDPGHDVSAEIEDRLSRWLEQRTGRITAWAAIDFLNECELLKSRDEEEEENRLPRLVDPAKQ